MSQGRGGRKNQWRYKGCSGSKVFRHKLHCTQHNLQRNVVHTIIEGNEKRVVFEFTVCEGVVPFCYRFDISQKRIVKSRTQTVPSQVFATEILLPLHAYRLRTNTSLYHHTFFFSYHSTPGPGQDTAVAVVNVTAGNLAPCSIFFW